MSLRSELLAESEKLMEQSYRNLVAVMLRLDAIKMEPAENLIDVTENIGDMIAELSALIQSDKSPI